MNILQLCNKPPFPLADGGCLAMNAVTQGLLDAGHSVHVLSISTPKHPDQRDQFSPAYLQRTRYETVFINTSVRAVPALLNLFSNRSYNIDRFDAPAFHQRLISLLKNETFDIIQLESLFLLPYLGTIRSHSKARIVLRAHNVEHLIWERLASGSRGLRATYLRLLAKRLKQYEIDALNKVDGIAAITAEDVLYFRKLGCRKPMLHLPFAMPLPEAGTVSDADFFHLGAMDWLPNREAVDWLLEKIWPLIHAKIPAAQLHLAGRGMPPGLKNGNGIKLQGEVHDAHAFMRQHSIMLVPLLSGGGMRIKLIEGLALGKAIVTTSVGMEGIPAIHEQHLLLADSAEAFAQAAIRLSEDAPLRTRLGEAGKIFVQEQFDRKRVTEKLSDFYLQILR